MQNMPPEDLKDQTIFTPPVSSMSGSQPPLQGEKPVPLEKNHPLFYTQEHDDELALHLPLMDEQDDVADQSSPFVLPFQHSAAMPTIATTNAQGAQGSMGSAPSVVAPARKKRWGSLQLLKILLIGSIVLITIIGASLFILAQSATSPSTPRASSTNPSGATGTSVVSPSKPTHARPARPTKTQGPTKPPQATAVPSRQGQGTQDANTAPAEGIPSAQLLNQLGWTQAGLTIADALEATRTGSTFTDREMSYDYRNIGTPLSHSGTLIGSTFLLTPGGKIRFIHNDVRMINNVLYNKICSEKLIQQVINAHPSLLQFQMIPIQGQPHTFAWVNVAFELLRSKSGPATGQRTESLETDPATGQPVLHHMTVVLVRVSLQNQGSNAPMGGTGWLVNTYALDATTQPAIATTPSL